MHDAEQFGWVHTPQELTHRVCYLADLDGSLCTVVDARLGADEYALWSLETWSGTAGSASWSLRCRISLASLPWPMRDELGGWLRVLPLCSSGGKILLATSHHKVYAYDPGSNSVDTVFSMQDFVDAPEQAALLLNIGLHEESVVSVCQPRAGDGRLKMKLGSNTAAKREGSDQHRPELTGFSMTRDIFQQMLGCAIHHYYNVLN